MQAPEAERVRTGSPAAEQTAACPPVVTLRILTPDDLSGLPDTYRKATHALSYRVYGDDHTTWSRTEVLLTEDEKIVGRIPKENVKQLPITDVERRMIDVMLGHIVLSKDGLAYVITGNCYQSADFATEWGPHTGILHGENGFGPMRAFPNGGHVITEDEYVDIWELAKKGLDEADKLERERVTVLLKDLPWVHSLDITDDQIDAYMTSQTLFPVHPDTDETFRLYPPEIRRDQFGQLETVLPGIVTDGTEQRAYAVVIGANGRMRTERFVGNSAANLGISQENWETASPMDGVNLLAAIQNNPVPGLPPRPQEFFTDESRAYLLTHDSSALCDVDRNAGAERVFSNVPRDDVTISVRSGYTSIYKGGADLGSHPSTPVERQVAGDQTLLIRDRNLVEEQYRAIRIAEEIKVGEGWIRNWVINFADNCSQIRPLTQQQQDNLIQYLVGRYTEAVNSGAPIVFPEGGIIGLAGLQPNMRLDEFADSRKTGFVSLRWDEQGKKGVLTRNIHRFEIRPDPMILLTDPQAMFRWYNYARTLAAPGHIAGEYAAAFNLTDATQSILTLGVGEKRQYWFLRKDTSGEIILRNKEGFRQLDDTPGDRRYSAVYQFLRRELAYDGQTHRLVPIAELGQNPALIAVSTANEMASDITQQVFEAGERLWYEEKLHAASEALADYINPKPAGTPPNTPPQTPKITADQLYSVLSAHVPIITGTKRRNIWASGQVGAISDVLFYGHTGNVTVRVDLRDMLGDQNSRKGRIYEFEVTHESGTPHVSLYQPAREGWRRAVTHYPVDKESLHHGFMVRFMEDQCVLTREGYIDVLNTWIDRQVAANMPGMFARHIQIGDDNTLVIENITMISENTGTTSGKKKTEYVYSDGAWKNGTNRVTPVERLWLQTIPHVTYTYVDGDTVTGILADLEVQTNLHREVQRKLGEIKYIEGLRQRGWFTTLMVSMALNEFPDNEKALRCDRFDDELIAQLADDSMMVYTTYDLGQPDNSSAQNNVSLTVDANDDSATIRFGFHPKNRHTWLDGMEPELGERVYLVEEHLDTDGSVVVTSPDLGILEPSRSEKRQIYRLPQTRVHGEPTYISGAIVLMDQELKSAIHSLAKHRFTNTSFRTISKGDRDSITWGLIAQELNVPSDTIWNVREIAAAWSKIVLQPYRRMIAGIRI